MPAADKIRAAFPRKDPHESLHAALRHHHHQAAVGSDVYGNGMIVCLPVGAHVEALDCLSWRLSSTGWLGGVYAPNVHHRQVSGVHQSPKPETR
jgi:hypothetical protein